jgi:hypothetical protein
MSSLAGSTSAKCRATSSQGGLVVLGRQQVVAAAVEDLLGDPGLAAHGVDRHQRAAEGQAVEQLGNGGDLVGLGMAGLLTQHQTLTAGPGRHHVQRAPIARAIVRAPRGLAVDRHHLRALDLRLVPAKAVHPLGEALGEEVAIQGVDHVVERVVTGNATSEGQEAAKEGLLRHRPPPDLHEVLGPG